MICEKCGKDHGGRCTAHRKLSRTEGILEPCKRWPARGGRVCKMHGHNPATTEKLQRQAEKERAESIAARFSVRSDVDATTALLELVQYQAGVVAFWRAELDRFDDVDFIDGVVTEAWRRKHSEPGQWSGDSAHAQRVYDALMNAQDRLAEYASTTLRAGVEERRVRIAEKQGELFYSAQHAILNRMLESVVQLLIEKGVGGEEIIESLRMAWSDAMGVVVPQELRAIAGSVT